MGKAGAFTVWRRLYGVKAWAEPAWSPLWAGWANKELLTSMTCLRASCLCECVCLCVCARACACVCVCCVCVCLSGDERMDTGCVALLRKFQLDAILISSDLISSNYHWLSRTIIPLFSFCWSSDQDSTISIQQKCYGVHCSVQYIKSILEEWNYMGDS